MSEIKLNNVFVWVTIMPLSNSNGLVDELAVHKLSETSKNTFHDSFTNINGYCLSWWKRKFTSQVNIISFFIFTCAWKIHNTYHCLELEYKRITVS